VPGTTSEVPGAAAQPCAATQARVAPGWVARKASSVAARKATIGSARAASSSRAKQFIVLMRCGGRR
jgi:hypothetical protein